MIGIVVEGLGEIEAIHNLLNKVQKTTPLICKPLRADLQPKANALVIARSARTAINQLTRRGATKIVILIDGEDHPCVVSFANSLRQGFRNQYPQQNLSIVVKNRTIENWLIADVSAIEKLPARFTVKAELRNAIQHQADEIANAERLLNRCALKYGYHKGDDPRRIAAHIDIAAAAAKSRSFRKFLREVGDLRFT